MGHTLGLLVLAYTLINCGWGTDDSPFMKQVCQKNDSCENNLGLDGLPPSDVTIPANDVIAEKPRFTAKYPFDMTQIPRYRWGDPQIWEALKKQEPVIFYGRPVFKTDVTWDLAYLKDRLASSDVNWNVVVAEGATFYDYNEDANAANYKWTKPYEKQKMPFRDFLKIYEELERVGNGSRVCIQSYLKEERMGDTVYRADTAFFKALQDQLGWGEALIWFVLLGQRDVITQCHYDADENIFQQVTGHKRFIFFHPQDFGKMYLYPAHHARDRYSQVDLQNPDYSKFPKFKGIVGHEAVLGPGDVLYVPTHWFHEVETAADGPSLSIAFRHKPRETAYYASHEYTFSLTSRPRQDGRVQFTRDINVIDPSSGRSWSVQKPDSDVTMVHLRRHIENIIAEATGSFRKVPEVLHEILDGRFDYLEFNEGEPI
jgi:hypoxia-inducible factor 1-alpha inhibitor (HIF hydroxylase)